MDGFYDVGTGVALAKGVKNAVDPMAVATRPGEGHGRVMLTSGAERASEPEEATASVDDALMLAQLSGPEQRRYLRRHKDLCTPQTVVGFCRRAAGLLRMDLPLARRMVAAAGSVAEALGDSASTARAERARAQLHHIQAEYSLAVEGYANSVAHYEAAGEDVQAAITRSSALHVLALLGRFELAESWAESSRELFSKIGDRVRLARLDANVAVVLHRQHDFEEALRLSLRAYERLRAQGTSQDVAVTLRNMLVCHVGLRNITMALDLFERAREFADRHRFRRLVLEAEYNIAYVHQMTGDYERAIHLYERTRASFRDWGDAFHEASCDLDQSEAYLDLNELADAESLARKALRRLEGLKVGQECGRSLVHLAIVAGCRGEATEALRLLDRSREVFGSCGDSVWERLNEVYRALVLEQSGRLPRALEIAGAAREASRSDVNPTRRAVFDALDVYLQARREGSDSLQEATRTTLERLTGVAGVPKMPSPSWLLAGAGDRHPAPVVAG